MRKLEDIQYLDTNLYAHLLDVYLPNEDEFPVFIYFHGGGLEGGSKTHKGTNIYTSLTKMGIAVVTADYRLYPKAKYPEFIEDAAAAVDWVHKNLPKFGKITGYFIGGSSAGSYLAEMLCFDKKYLGKYDIDPDSISGYVFNAGQTTTHFNVLCERGIDPNKVVVDEAAALYHITEDRTYPPILVTLADNDLATRLEQNQLLIAALKRAGMKDEDITLKIFENTTHCSYVGSLNEHGDYPFANALYEFIMCR